jgi:hypothetical protein
MSSGSQARTLRREAASLFACRSREADDSVLVKTERAGDIGRVIATRVYTGRAHVSVYFHSVFQTDFQPLFFAVLPGEVGGTLLRSIPCTAQAAS